MIFRNQGGGDCRIPHAAVGQLPSVRDSKSCCRNCPIAPVQLRAEDTYPFFCVGLRPEQKSRKTPPKTRNSFGNGATQWSGGFSLRKCLYLPTDRLVGIFRQIPRIHPRDPWVGAFIAPHRKSSATLFAWEHSHFFCWNQRGQWRRGRVKQALMGTLDLHSSGSRELRSEVPRRLRSGD